MSRRTCACGVQLTLEETRFYGDSCEECAQAQTDRIARWVEGEEDPGLEALYGVKRVLH